MQIRFYKKEWETTMVTWWLTQVVSYFSLFPGSNRVRIWSPHSHDEDIDLLLWDTVLVDWHLRIDVRCSYWEKKEEQRLEKNRKRWERYRITWC